MSRKRNTFSKALKHLKTDGIVEAAPINSTMGVYSIVPGTLTRTKTVPGPTIPDESTIDWDIDGGSGGDTSGLFDSEGNSKLIAPPGDNSYILGPMAAMFYNYASNDWTMLGYIREADRRFVNLGYLYQNKTAGSEFSGELSDWDGVNDFNSYGQLTLEQALWFRDTKKKDNAGNDPDNYNYRAFYPGPPSSTPDAFGRYLCCITGTPKATKDTTVTTTTADMDLQGSDNFSAMMDTLTDKAGKIDWNKVEQGINMGMLLWDVVAVLGIIFPEPGTSIAGAARLATRLAGLRKIKQSLRNRFLRGALNPFGQRTVRSGAAGRVRQTVYSGRPYKGARKHTKKFEFGSTDKTTAQTYTNPNLKGMPGSGGGGVNPRGTLDTGSLPQRYIDKYGSRSVGGQKQIKMSKTVGKKVFNSYDMDGNLLFEGKMDSQIDKFMQIVEKLGEKELNNFFEKLLDHLEDAIENEYDGDPRDLHPDNPINSEEDPWALRKQQTQEGVNLSEDKKTRIMKSLKEPVVLPETKKKSYKVSPGKRNKTNFQGMDKLVTDVRSQKPFKRTQDIWSKEWQGYNSKLSQEKKNEVLEMIGDGKLAFNYMLTDSKKMNADQLDEFWGLNPDFHSYFFGGKKYKATRKEQVKGDYIVFLIDEDGNKSSMLQSELNIKLEEENQKEMLNEYNKILSEQEPNPFFKDPLMKKVAKRLKNEIDYEGKPAVKGYPNEPPPQMVKGFHPEYGKKYKYDKLDPVSAVAMRGAPTGNPEIDANVEKAAKKIKKLKPKVKEDYFDWRQSLQESDWTNVTSGNKVGQTFRHVSGATIRTGGALGGVETIPTSVTVDGETLSAPPISDYGLQGHASPIDGWEIARKNNKKKAKQINAQLDASEEVARRANADALMQARVDDYYEEVDKINTHNNKVREDNINKIKDHIKSLKLNVSYDELVKKGAISIEGGAIGIEDDGKGNIKIGVFKGPDVYIKGRMIYHKGQEYSSEVEDFNTEEGVKEVPSMPSDVSKWVDSQSGPFSSIKSSQDLSDMISSWLSKKLVVPGDKMSYLNPILPRGIRAPGKMFIGYLIGGLKPTDNAAQVLDPQDIKSSWENLSIWEGGNSLSVGGYMQNVFGGESLSQLQKQGNNAVLKFNFAPHINEKEFAQHPGKYSAYQQAVIKALGPYTADLQVGPGIASPVIGALASYYTMLSKATYWASRGKLGGGQNLSGSITIPMDELKTVNPEAYDYLNRDQNKSKPTPKPFGQTKRQSLSLDEPIVRDKKKKKVNESKALSKIKNQFSYKGQPSADGFPDSPPPEMKDGWHPRYGKNANRYKKLDPDSANAMPKTGDAETDAIVAKQKSKS